jgi:hypothetical protein
VTNTVEVWAGFRRLRDTVRSTLDQAEELIHQAHQAPRGSTEREELARRALGRTLGCAKGLDRELPHVKRGPRGIAKAVEKLRKYAEGRVVMLTKAAAHLMEPDPAAPIAPVGSGALDHTAVIAGNLKPWETLK